ncbi:MAG: 5-deoxy-glucuronate isomerase [Nakamurella sp.]
MSDAHFVPAGSTQAGPFELVITPEGAHWGYSSLRVLTISAGHTVPFETGIEEMILLPLSGACSVRINSERFDLAGRKSVFDGVTDFAYLPIAEAVEVTSVDGGTFALPGAVTDELLPFRYGPASGVPVELRGAGSCSRQVNNFGTPGAFDTGKLIACEVITPAGNWSSYPPHKHDETSEGESSLEEIYYYRFRSHAPDTAVAAAGKGAGFQRVYGTEERPIDVLEEVGDGDVVLIPHGWHGPSIASPSHDMYYLNVMAGPEPTRAWKICDDPDHGWVRGTWAHQSVDPRLPFYPAPAPTAG